MVQAYSAATSLRTRAAGLEARAHLALLKMRIVVPLVFVATVMAIVAGSGAVYLDKIGLLVLAGGLASAGAACLNHYLDRDIDAVMQRTRNRPIPSGAIRNPATAALLGLGLIALAVVTAAALNYLTVTFIALGALFYAGVYTLWLKRRSPLNVVIGGFAGSCAVLAGWTAVDSSLSLTPVLVALIVFLWTPSHFWSLAIFLKDDYRRVGVPMLPVLIGERKTAWVIAGNTILTVLLSLLPHHLGLFGVPYLAMAVVAGFLVLRANVRLLLNPSGSEAWRNYKLSGMYLGLVFVGMLVDSTV
ncbi:MAG: protoheme IX farnesyltransferase [Chloroflexi bacterium]|nr:protoheme IX farnesyltransferase [Chloroflexota bacterium]